MLTGNIDQCDELGLIGWASNSNNTAEPTDIDIFLNNSRIARLSAMIFRSDLKAAGISSGIGGFVFPIQNYLKNGENSVRVVHASTQALIPGGDVILVGNLFNQDLEIPVSEAAIERLHLMSQKRWKGVEDPTGLTWGKMMTGQTFIDTVQKHCNFYSDLKICELGVGYGRLLYTLIRKGLAFRSYVGIELSPGRSSLLKEKFAADNRINIVQADLLKYQLTDPANLLICSATFEHLFPDCSLALSRVYDNLASGGLACIDFIKHDDNLDKEYYAFESLGHAFVRIYSKAELEKLFNAAGLELLKIDFITLGEGVHGSVERALAIARKN